MTEPVRRRYGAAAWIAAALVTAAFPAGAEATRVRIFDSAKGIPAGPVSSLLVAHDRLYVGTRGQGLLTYDLAGGRTRTFRREDGLPSGEIRSLAAYRGKVYAGTSEGIAVEEGDRWTAITQAKNVRLRNVVLAASPDGKELWASAVHLTGGTVRFDGAEWVFLGGEGRGLFNEVNSFGFLPDSVLMGAMTGAVYRVRGTAIDLLDGGFPPANVMAVGERGGTVYAGTNRGLYRWRGRGWTPAPVPRPFEGSAVYSIVRSEIDLFVAGAGGLLLLDRRGEARILSGRNGVPEGPVTALALADGVLYAATGEGVVALTGWEQ